MIRPPTLVVAGAGAGAAFGREPFVAPGRSGSGVPASAAAGFAESAARGSSGATTGAVALAGAVSGAWGAGFSVVVGVIAVGGGETAFACVEDPAMRAPTNTATPRAATAPIASGSFERGAAGRVGSLVTPAVVRTRSPAPGLTGAFAGPAGARTSDGSGIEPRGAGGAFEMPARSETSGCETDGPLPPPRSS
jgi:hypothetical protein